MEKDSLFLWAIIAVVLVFFAFSGSALSEEKKECEKKGGIVVKTNLGRECIKAEVLK